MAMFSAQELLGRHGIAYIATQKKSYTTNCPGCGKGYCSVKIDNKGVRWFCHDCQHSGGEYYDQPDETKREEPKAVYDYTDEDDKRLYQSLRFEPVGKTKYFRQRTSPDQKKWSIKGVRLVPFHLPRLIEAIENDEVVWVVEGEKDVLTLERHGIPATCCAMGAEKWKAEYNQHFGGADVVVCGDNDDPGRRHVRQVANALLPVARCVRILDLKIIWPQIEQSDDISDWFARADGASADALHEIIGHITPLTEAPPWEDGDSVLTNGHDTSAPAKLILTTAEFLKRFVPPDYLIDGVIQRRFLYAFTGKTNSGKTAVALFIAATVALGRNIGNIEVEKGRVLYFAGENPDDILYRWTAMTQRMDFDENIDVHFVMGVFKLSEIRDRIIEETKRIGEFALVIIDSSAAYYEGVEVNSNTEQIAHARRMRSFTELPGGPCVIVICHPVKYAATDNLLPYGAGAFLNEIDGNLTCVSDFPAIEVHWQGKFRGAEFEPLTFRLVQATHERLVNKKGKVMPQVVAEYLSEAAKDEIQKANLTDRQRLVAEIAKDGKATVAEYAARCGFVLANGLPNKNKTHRMISMLRKQKLVTGEPRDYSVHEPKKRTHKDAKNRTDDRTEGDLLDNVVPLSERRRTQDHDEDKNK